MLINHMDLFSSLGSVVRTLPSPHSTPFTPHPTLHPPCRRYTLCCTLPFSIPRPAPQDRSTLHAPRSTLRAPPSKAATPHSTLYVSLHTLQSESVRILGFTLPVLNFALHALHCTMPDWHSTLLAAHALYYFLRALHS